MTTNDRAGEGTGRLGEAWVVYGSTAGILSVLAYLGAATGVAPDRIGLVLAFAFGPLLSVAFVGLYHFLRVHRNTVALQVATLFGVLAGTVVNMMLVVQQALFVGVPKAAREAMGAAWSGLNWIQLGLDVSWDIYIGVATILLGVAMASHPRFGKIAALVSIGLGAALLALNLAAFPTPPGESGSVDVGPFVGLWYLLLCLRARTSVGWWRTAAG